MKLLLLKRTCWVLKILPGVMLCLASGASPTGAPEVPAGDDSFSQCRQLGRGINVLGYDPIWESKGKARFKAEHFRIIRAGGFETLRVNLQPNRLMGAAPEFRLSDSWWQTMDWIVSNAIAADLNVIVDFHEFESRGNDTEERKGRFLAFWRQVAPRFQKAPSRVLFEMLNEPNGQITSEVWNEYLAEALGVIRSSNPTRTVIIGPAFYNSIDHLEGLKLPKEDRHLIVTVHYYSPMDFTHQGAPWAARYKDKLGVEWKGSAQERAAITSDFQKAQDWAKQHHRPIFLGEFGAYDKGDMASRVRYTDCVARTAERLGWSWAYWQFDSNFIVYDIQKCSWVEPIHHALIPQGGSVAAQRSLD